MTSETHPALECCGTETIADTEMRGTTCGGLAAIGAMRCAVCGTGYVMKGVTREAAASDGGWTLAGGGRSVNCGGIRIRAEGKHPSGVIATLMARIVRLPELEQDGTQPSGTAADDPSMQTKPERVTTIPVDPTELEQWRIAADRERMTIEQWLTEAARLAFARGSTR